MLEASNGLEAIALWHEWRPHFIWMDLRMPSVNGYEAVRQIRAQEALTPHQHTKIVALTAQTSESDRDLALAAGCDDYMSKPVQVNLMFEKLAEQLGLKYTYSDSSSEQDFALSRQSLTFADLAMMPRDWLEAFHHAALIGDDKTLMVLVESMPSDQAAIAHQLQLRIEQFEFDKLISLVQPCLDGQTS
ncbi:MAG: response regulator [Cyanobacteria bacterium]|nr:response regulator [Cyanobacteriota bacterium]MDW8201343.1 response regulator [Cyanobacteriota bacterium SKYGB_h_bin112]